MADLVIVIMIAGAVAAIIRKQIRDRKEGKTGCGCGCSGCAGCGHCGPEIPKEDRG